MSGCCMCRATANALSMPAMSTEDRPRNTGRARPSETASWICCSEPHRFGRPSMYSASSRTVLLASPSSVPARDQARRWPAAQGCGCDRLLMLRTPAVAGLVTAWWVVLQAQVVQIRHRAGGAAACRQPSCPPRQRPPAVKLIARSFSDRAALHRPLGSPQPGQLHRQRPGAMLQIPQLITAVERPPVAAASPAAPIAGLRGTRTGVVRRGPARAASGLAEPRAGRDGDLPGPAGLPATHEVSPPWPGCQAPTNPPSGRARPSRSRIAGPPYSPAGRTRPVRCECGRRLKTATAVAPAPVALPIAQ